MRAYSSLKQLEEKVICVDEYRKIEQEGVFKATFDYKRLGKIGIFLPTSSLKIAVRL